MTGIEFLEKEDPYSRTPDENGKRIARLDEHRPWGWYIVNHKQYRNMASAVDRREQNRINKQKQRDRDRVSECQRPSAMSAHTNTDTITKVSGKGLPNKEIVDYLNQKANTRYKHTTKATQRFIRARFNEGFTLEDFFSVIDNKSKEWKTDAKMVKFLRPETLFGTKFESYLQEAKPEKEYVPFGLPGD